MRDTCIFNQRAKINHTVGYICFLSFYEQSEDEHTLDCIWRNQYLSASLIDCITVNTFCVNEFFFSLVDKQLRRNTVKHTICEVFGSLFCKNNIQAKGRA